MKPWILTLLALLGLPFVMNGQIVITEISYNNPTFDDYEYIELYNNSASIVDLSGWGFSQGINYSFPSGFTMMPGAYQVLSIDSVLFFNTFGVLSRQWTNGSLANGGEDIVLLDAMSNGIDTVDYDAGNLWPTIARGFGPSLILCDVNADNNDVANWSFSTRPTGTVLGGAMIFGSPGMANDTCPTTPTIFFYSIEITIPEGNAVVDIDPFMANVGPADTMTVDLILGVGTTATPGVDFTFTNTTLGIGPSGQGGVSACPLSIPILNDMDIEGDETIVFTLANPQGGVIAAMGDLIVTITDDDTPPPLYPIGLITADATGNGLPDSLGVICRIEGVVHGVDLQAGNSISFTIIDSTGGIRIFSSQDFGYTVTEGDSVRIQGTVDHFIGLARMEGIDTVIFLSAGNPTMIPEPVTVLDETTENELVSLECVTIVNPADWPDPAGGFGVNIDVTNGVDTFAVWIEGNTDVNGMPLPASKWLNITGLGGQLDGFDPRTSGYQLVPRYRADVAERNPIVGFTAATATVSEGAGSTMVMLRQADGNPDSTILTVKVDATSTATNGIDFSVNDTTILLTGCEGDTATLPITLIDDLEVEGAETIVLTITTVTNDAVIATATQTITIQDDATDQIEDLLPANAVRVYPNPAIDLIRIESRYRMESISLVNLFGQEIMTQSPDVSETSIAVADLATGVYLISVQTAEGRWTGRFVKQ